MTGTELEPRTLCAQANALTRGNDLPAIARVLMLSAQSHDPRKPKVPPVLTHLDVERLSALATSQSEPPELKRLAGERGTVSVSSPLGTSLLGMRVGRSCGGLDEWSDGGALRVVAIAYQPEAAGDWHL